jgi:carbonic anhydrase
MLGLFLGEAKILRTPGGRVTPDALIGCVLGAHLLHVDRILVIAHTRCAMASGTDEEIRDRILGATGADLGDLTIGATPDQETALTTDVALLRDHPALAGRTSVGGFVYDVDSGLLRQVC